MNRSLKTIGCVLLLTVSACGGSPVPERYSLTAAPLQATPCRGQASIKFHMPNVAPGIDNKHIVVMDSPNHLTFYQGVSWATNAGRMVQHFLADSFEQSGMFATVSSDMDTVAADYEVESDLREFHIDQSAGAPMVQIRLTAHVSRAHGGRVVKSLPLARQASAAGATIEGIVAIFNEQMHSMAQELQERLATSIPACRR